MSNKVEVMTDEQALKLAERMSYIPIPEKTLACTEEMTIVEQCAMASKMKAVLARLGVAMAALVDVAETRQRIYTASEKAMRAQDAITTIRGMP